MKVLKNVSAVLPVMGVFLASVSNVYAQTISVGTVNAKATIGSITTFGDLVRFLINFTIYTGWVGAVFGVGAAIALIIWRSMSGDSEEAVKNFQSYMTKAVLLVVAGILLACFGYIIKVIVTFIPGLTPPADLNTGIGGAAGSTGTMVNPF